MTEETKQSRPPPGATVRGISPMPPATQRWSLWAADRIFVLALSLLGGLYVVLIVAMLLADCRFTSLAHLLQIMASREIRYATGLSLISSSVTAILSVWIAVPLGYLLSRFRFPGRWQLDALLDIPIVLPPLVIGLSLLILFQTPPGKALEALTQNHMGSVVTYLVVPWLLGPGLLLSWKVLFALLGQPFPIPSAVAWRAALLVALMSLTILWLTSLGAFMEAWAQAHFATDITYAIPSVILAQFSVACAFAVRTMRVCFDQIPIRHEQVAMTLGCSRARAFWWVVLPEARRGIITAFTLSWARALGEFGPILVFSGATRMKTEVLPTTVFLELSVGNLNAAVAVSLLMVVVAVFVLVIVRFFGLEKAV